MALIERDSKQELAISATRDDRILELTRQKAIAEKLDVVAIKKGTATKPTFVLEQFPAPGEEVAAGTTINLVMLPKDRVQVDDVVVDLRIKEAFREQDVTKVREDIDDKPRVKEVFDRNIEYEALNAEDKKVVNEYMIEKGIATQDATAEDFKVLHDDIDVLYKF